MNEIPFFKDQMFWAMRNKGLIDPEVIDEYIARDGYFGAAKALQEMSPEQIIAEVKISGLRGRGGAGFSTGLKWEFASKSPGEIKYVLCNADEGDPGAFMDRSILEADPHAVLEGMIIAAKAINAHQGYIYARTEESTDCWEQIYWGPASISILIFTRAQVRLSAEKRRP
jgi:NADH-quinone oxidoreductase subunit F/NAD(P)H dehydrogenase (quinone)/NADP-reducing hydrogenase subunit HndC